MSRLSLGSLSLPQAESFNPDEYSLRRFKGQGRVLDGGGSEDGIGQQIQRSGGMNQYQQLQLLRALQNDDYERKLAERDFQYKVYASDRDFALKLEKERFDRSKGVFDQFVQTYSKASDNPALQEHLANAARGFISSMSPAHQQMMVPFINNSPFSLKQQNLKMWERMNPMPQVVSDPELNPYSFASEVLQLEDWNAMRTTFATGQPPEKRQMIPLGNGNIILRNKNGFPALTTETQLAITQLAKENNMTPGELAANDGWVSGKKVRVKTPRGVIDVTPQANVINGKTKTQEDFVQDLPFERMSARKSKLYDDFLIEFAAKDSKGTSSGATLARQVKDILSNGTKEAEFAALASMQAAFPEMTFIFVPKKREQPWYGKMINAMIAGGERTMAMPYARTLAEPTFDIVKQYAPWEWIKNIDLNNLQFFESEGKDYTVRSAFALPTQMIDPEDSYNYGTYVYDQEKNMVYNGMLEPLGTLEDFFTDRRKKRNKK